MMLFVRLIAFALTILIIFSCSQSQTNKTDPEAAISFFDPFELGALNERNNLKINARFSECGEWGGHKETITLYADKDKMFHATYEVFPFNCDSLDYYYGNDSLKPTIDKKITLTEKGKKSVIDYIQRLVQSKITERLPGHACNFFSVTNSDSSLIIEVCDTKEFDVKSFKQLTTELLK